MVTNMLTYETLRTLPKIDLHRHLEGSLRLGTLSEIARTHGVDLLDVPAEDANQLRPYVQVMDDKPNFETFLAKFNVLRHFYRSPEAVARLTYEAIIDAAADNVRYLELRFSPQALARVRGFPLEDVTDWVIEAASQATRVCDIEVGLIVTLVRHESIEIAEQVANVAFARANKGIIGIDLAGDEVNYSALPYRDIFKDARSHGLGITVHAGEWTGAESIRIAVEELGAQRLGHGVRIVDDPDVLALVKEKDVTLELCLTSNVQTGAVESIYHHPIIPLLDEQTRVTLNTDDPSVSDCTLTDEYAVAVDSLNATYEDLRVMTHNAVEAAFASDETKKRLVAEFDRLMPTERIAAD